MDSCKRRLFGLVLSLLLAVTLLGGYQNAGAAANSAAAAGPVVTLSVDQPSFDAAQGVVIHVTISNPSDHPVRVLKWFTPAEDVEESLFAVSVDGAPVSYLGPVYKRPAPKGEDYISLKAGESLARDVDLAAYYDLSVTGTYAVHYEVASPALYGEKGDGLVKRVDSLTSNEVTFWVKGQPGSAVESVSPLAVTGSTKFNKCTASQQSALLSARSQASTYSAGALSYLNANKQGSRYSTWFGVYNSSRYSTVTSHFSAINNAMDTAPVNFDCGCKKNYYAYVYPSKPYFIYLCRVFWSAPLTGTDSKAGTLIHEMSHFTVVASTNDYVYGQTGAKNLAISDPSKAVNNADNHEYFAENTPALP